jgi:hypothetical protein
VAKGMDGRDGPLDETLKGANAIRSSPDQPELRFESKAGIVPACLLLTGRAHQPAKAEAPWCAVVTIGEDSVIWDCRFRTIEECRPTVLAGNRGFCNPNPYFVATERKRQRKQ